MVDRLVVLFVGCLVGQLIVNSDKSSLRCNAPISIPTQTTFVMYDMHHHSAGLL